MAWYANINDLVGGWCVGTQPGPLSATMAAADVADMMTEANARKVVGLETSLREAQEHLTAAIESLAFWQGEHDKLQAALEVVRPHVRNTVPRGELDGLNDEQRATLLARSPVYLNSPYLSLDQSRILRQALAPKGGAEALREEFIVCYAPGYPDPYRPWPNTLENARRFAEVHRQGWVNGKLEPAHPVIKRRYVSEWVDIVPDGGGAEAEA